MPPEQGQNLRLVKDGSICGNPYPHLDVEDRDQIRSETAKPLVSCTPDYRRRTLNTTACRHTFQPVIQHGCGSAFQTREFRPVAVPINDCKSAKRHADIRI